MRPREPPSFTSRTLLQWAAERIKQVRTTEKLLEKQARPWPRCCGMCHVALGAATLQDKTELRKTKGEEITRDVQMTTPQEAQDLPSAGKRKAYGRVCWISKKIRKSFLCGVRDLGFGHKTATNGLKEKVGSIRRKKWVRLARQAQSDCGQCCSQYSGAMGKWSGSHGDMLADEKAPLAMSATDEDGWESGKPIICHPWPK